MRVLVCHPGPHFSVQDVYTGYVEALRELGVQVGEFNLGDRLTFYASAFKQVTGHRGATEAVFKRMLESDEAVIELAVNGLCAALFKYRPDVLLVVSAFLMTPELLDHIRGMGTAVIILHTESPYEDERQLELAPHADLNLLNDPINIEAFQDVAKTVYLPHAYRPKIHYPSESYAKGHDLIFVGTGFESRIEFFGGMLERLARTAAGRPDAVGLAGNWQRLPEGHALRSLLLHDVHECCDNETAADLYRNSLVGMNLYRREAQRPELEVGWAMSPREVEMAACGLFFVRDSRGEGDETLSMLPTFSGAEEAADLVRYWLRHDNERQRIAIAAREAIAERTFIHYAGALLQLIE